MAQLIADKRDVDFVLYEQMKAQELTKYELFNEFDQKTFDLIISEARLLGIKEILPTYMEGDREGAHFENGKVEVPKCYRRAHKLYVQGEWTAMTEDPELGGQGLPHIIETAANEYLVGANYSLTTYGNMGHGTGILIERFGTQKQKDLFLKNLYSAQWGGTMAITEPDAGSDVGALTTSAVKNDDETYSITGNKIFITSGDHDLTENIIHPVLARIEGAPPGSKGISIFIVPKIRVNKDGSLGEPNDVVCTGIEDKFGIHGQATCALSFGSKGKCRGFLLGEENRGMEIMFHMMNNARLLVGAQGFYHASSAYLYALTYAKERIQGRSLDAGKDRSAPPVPIIQHPDVRRMLMGMKAYVEGMRSFIYYVAACFDKKKCAASEEEKTYYDDLAGFLTPLVKSYCSDRGFEVCVQAMQVYGGYGYTKEYPVEQLVRDCKITSIYEGTNGIQSMDFLGRQLGFKQGKVFAGFIEEIKKTIAIAGDHSELKELTQKLQTAINRLETVAEKIGAKIKSPEYKAAFAFSMPFLDVTGDVIMAWMLLWRAAIATSKLRSCTKKKDINFYEGQLKTAEFFIYTLLPATLGKMEAIEEGKAPTIEITEAAFGG